MPEGRNSGSCRQNLSIILRSSPIRCQIPDRTRPLSRLPSVVLSSSAASILGYAAMPENNGGTGLDPLTKATNDIAREIGEMDPDDPLR